MNEPIETLQEKADRLYDDLDHERQKVAILQERLRAVAKDFNNLLAASDRRLGASNQVQFYDIDLLVTVHKGDRL
jgi:hypothetical protein